VLLFFNAFTCSSNSFIRLASNLARLSLINLIKQSPNSSNSPEGVPKALRSFSDIPILSSKPVGKIKDLGDGMGKSKIWEQKDSL